MSFQINRRDTNPPELQINKVADKIRQFKINQGSIVQLIKITRKHLFNLPKNRKVGDLMVFGLDFLQNEPTCFRGLSVYPKNINNFVDSSEVGENH